MHTRFTWRSVIGEWCRPTRGDAPGDVPDPLAEFLTAGGATALSFQNRFQTAVSVCDLQASTPEYVPVGCRLDAFLSAAAVIEMALGAPINLATQGPTRSADEVVGLDRVELPELGRPHGVTTSYYAGPDLLAFAHDEEGYSFAFVAARSPEALRDVDQRVKNHANWDFA